MYLDSMEELSFAVRRVLPSCRVGVLSGLASHTGHLPGMESMKIAPLGGVPVLVIGAAFAALESLFNAPGERFGTIVVVPGEVAA